MTTYFRDVIKPNQTQLNTIIMPSSLKSNVIEPKTNAMEHYVRFGLISNAGKSYNHSYSKIVRVLC